MRGTPRRSKSNTTCQIAPKNTLASLYKILIQANVFAVI